MLSSSSMIVAPKRVQLPALPRSTQKSPATNLLLRTTFFAISSFFNSSSCWKSTAGCTGQSDVSDRKPTRSMRDDQGQWYPRGDSAVPERDTWTLPRGLEKSPLFPIISIRFISLRPVTSTPQRWPPHQYFLLFFPRHRRRLEMTIIEQRRKSFIDDHHLPSQSNPSHRGPSEIHFWWPVCVAVV